MIEILGIIPARLGSKGVKNKNIKIINNKYLIDYTVKRAKQSKLLTDIVASTDSSKYAKLFKQKKIWIPGLRPKKLSTSVSNIIDTLVYTTNICEKIKNKKYDYVVLLQPTSPLRKKNEIDLCLQKLIKSNCDSLISLSVVNISHPIKLKRIKNNKVTSYIKNSQENPPRQILEKLFMPSGNLYAVKRDQLIKNKTLVGKKQTFYLIKNNDYLNIDNPDDIELAKIKLKKYFK